MPTAKKNTSNTQQGTDAVNTFMAKLQHPCKDSIQDYRMLILSADPNVKEQIKWNAPSFFIDDHFATFRLHPSYAVQIVLHTGAKVKAQPKKFIIDDPHNLLKWSTSDRCTLILKSAEHAQEMKGAVASIIKQWIQQL